MDLFDKVSEDIKNAMKAKDKVALETLRNIKKFFIEAKTAPGAKKPCYKQFCGRIFDTARGLYLFPQNRRSTA